MSKPRGPPSSGGRVAKRIRPARSFLLRASKPSRRNHGALDMLWTEEAIEVLKLLALEGRSASVIAAALGAPSRNAVIGKANRIGIKLNGGPGGAAPGGRAAMPAGMQAVMRSTQLAAIARPEPCRDAQIHGPAVSAQPKRKVAWLFAAAEVGEMRRAGFEEIHEFACRWPLGDPTSHDF